MSTVPRVRNPAWKSLYLLLPAASKLFLQLSIGASFSSFRNSAQLHPAQVLPWTPDPTAGLPSSCHVTLTASQHLAPAQHLGESVFYNHARTLSVLLIFFCFWERRESTQVHKRGRDRQRWRDSQAPGTLSALFTICVPCRQSSPWNVTHSQLLFAKGTNELLENKTKI